MLVWQRKEDEKAKGSNKRDICSVGHKIMISILAQLFLKWTLPLWQGSQIDYLVL